MKTETISLFLALVIATFQGSCRDQAELFSVETAEPLSADAEVQYGTDPKSIEPVTEEGTVPVNNGADANVPTAPANDDTPSASGPPEADDAVTPEPLPSPTTSPSPVPQPSSAPRPLPESTPVPVPAPAPDRPAPAPAPIPTPTPTPVEDNDNDDAEASERERIREMIASGEVLSTFDVTSFRGWGTSPQNRIEILVAVDRNGRAVGPDRPSRTQIDSSEENEGRLSNSLHSALRICNRSNRSIFLHAGNGTPFSHADDPIRVGECSKFLVRNASSVRDGNTYDHAAGDDRENWIYLRIKKIDGNGRVVD